MKTSSHTTDALFDLGDFIAYLLAKWRWFITAGLCFAVVFALVSLKIPNKYQSEILLSDADSGNSSMSNIAGQLGGLASFAGINLNVGKEKKLVALQILKSRQFLINFVKDNHLEALVVAVEKWDKETEKFFFNQDIYNSATEKWLPDPEFGGTYYPSDLEIYEVMKAMIEVDVDNTNKVTHIYLTYYSPVEAQKWLTMLVIALNDKIRKNDISERNSQMTFLQNELSVEQNSDIRNVYYSVIEEQIKASTLAKARDEYVFSIIDPAVLPESKSSPKRALNTVLGGLVGGVLCFIFFAVRYTVVGSKNSLIKNAG